jgi:hypothetical protein
MEISTQQSAFGIQPTQQGAVVLTGILPSMDAVMGTKTLNHRGRRGSQRKTFFCRRIEKLFPLRSCRLEIWRYGAN